MSGSAARLSLCQISLGSSPALGATMRSGAVPAALSGGYPPTESR